MSVSQNLLAIRAFCAEYNSYPMMNIRKIDKRVLQNINQAINDYVNNEQVGNTYYNSVRYTSGYPEFTDLCQTANTILYIYNEQNNPLASLTQPNSPAIEQEA